MKISNTRGGITMKKSTIVGMCLISLALIFTGCIKQQGRDNPVDPGSVNYLPPAPSPEVGTVVCYVYLDEMSDPPSLVGVEGANVYLYEYDQPAGTYNQVAHAVTDAQGRAEFHEVPASPANYWLKCLNNDALNPNFMDLQEPAGMLWYEAGYYMEGFPVENGRTIGADGGSDGMGFYFYFYNTPT